MQYVIPVQRQYMFRLNQYVNIKPGPMQDRLMLNKSKDKICLS